MPLRQPLWLSFYRPGIYVMLNKIYVSSCNGEINKSYTVFILKSYIFYLYLTIYCDVVKIWNQKSKVYQKSKDILGIERTKPTDTSSVARIKAPFRVIKVGNNYRIIKSVLIIILDSSIRIFHITFTTFDIAKKRIVQFIWIIQFLHWECLLEVKNERKIVFINNSLILKRSVNLNNFMISYTQEGGFRSRRGRRC